MTPLASHRLLVGSKPSMSAVSPIVTLPPGLGVAVETPAPEDVELPLLEPPPPQAARIAGALPSTVRPAAVLAPRARKVRRSKGSGLGTVPPCVMGHS